MDDTKISYDQVRLVIDQIHRCGYHVVPATEETVKVALRAHEAKALFVLTAPDEGDE